MHRKANAMMYGVENLTDNESGGNLVESPEKLVEMEWT